MECSELCPYNTTKFDCEVPQLTEEQVKNIQIVDKIYNNLYSGYIFNHPILISTHPNDGICTQILLYSNSMRFLGAWKCQLTNKSITIIENTGYRLLQDNIDDYISTILSIYKINSLGISHNNIKKDTILFGDGPKFLDFSKISEYKLPTYEPDKLKIERKYVSDLYDVNKLFPSLGNLPEWDRIFQDFYKRNSEYPKLEDIQNILELKFKRDRIILYPKNTISSADTSVSFVNIRYVNTPLITQLQVLYKNNCNLELSPTDFRKENIDFVVLVYEEYDIEAFYMVKLPDHIKIQGKPGSYNLHQIKNLCVREKSKNKNLLIDALLKYISNKVKPGEIVFILVGDEKIKEFTKIGFMNTGKHNGLNKMIFIQK